MFIIYKLWIVYKNN